MEQLKQYFPGILLATAIGFSGYFISGYLTSSFNSILVALLLGMLAGNTINFPENFQSGIGFTSGKLLELSILFLAFSINYSHIAALGVGSFSIIATMVIAMLLFTYYFSAVVKCPGSTGWLVGFGTTICGSSAIAALAPGVTRNKEDVGISMAVVNLFGSIGMVVMPMMLVKTDFTTTQMGLLIGGTLHSVGNVAGSGYALSNAVGEAAVTIKLARVALLSPALMFFNYLVNRHKAKSWVEHFMLPWYLWGFIGITVFSSLVSLPVVFLEAMETSGKVILTVAMAAIGLKVSFKKLYQSGQKGLVFGFAVFAVQVIMVATLMLLL
jgi:uncharacterized integral membrane protein (TIGR00698 family)